MPTINVKRKLIVETIIIFSIFFLSDILILNHFLHILTPEGDEFSLTVESKKPVWHWFLEGYSRYFNVYPEFYDPASNFIRPVANLIYRFFSNFENGFKLQLVGVNYLTHAGIGALLYFYGNKFSNTKLCSLLIALAAYLTPTFWATEMVRAPGFMLDALVTLFCLVGLIFIKSKQTWICFIFLTLAVFTKEAALPIVAGVMVYALITRNLSSTLASFLIIILYFAIRTIAFKNAVGGIYALHGIESVSSFLSRFLSLLNLPIALAGYTDIKNFILNQSVTNKLLYVLSNLIFWVVFFISRIKIDVSAIKNIIKSPTSTPANTHYLVLLLICTLFSAIYLAITLTILRFTYVFYILLLAVLTIPNAYKVRTEILLGILLFTSSIVWAGSIKKIHSDYHSYEFLYQSSSNLIDTIKSSPSIEPVYIMNDFVSSFSKEENVASYAGAVGEYKRGSSLELFNCQDPEILQISQQVNVEGNLKLFITKIPDCMNFTFQFAGDKKILDNLSGDSLYRNETISYRFPYIKIGHDKKSGKDKVESLGNVMIANIKDSAIIYFDFSNRKWIYNP
jgi:predicted membrane-bound dolichyl-phosphate-mannose-protein mannosyltransferase